MNRTGEIEISMTTILVFGTGSSAASFLANLSESVRVRACLDNNRERQGTQWQGIPVLSPGLVTELTYDYVVIASQFIAPIREQLLHLGVPHERILPLYPVQYAQNLLHDYKSALQSLYRSASQRSGKPKIRLLTANRSGCNARALYEYVPEEMRQRYDIALITDFASGATEADCVGTTHRNGTLTGNGINVSASSCAGVLVCVFGPKSFAGSCRS